MKNTLTFIGTGVVLVGGLLVYGFGSQPVDVSKVAVTTAPSAVVLPQALSDKEIMASLAPGSIFADNQTALAAIKALTDQQPNGEKGALLNNDWPNLFYTPDAVIVVSRSDAGWSVSSIPLNSITWHQGVKIFSAQ